LAHRIKKNALMPYFQAIDEKPVLRHNFATKGILTESLTYFGPAVMNRVLFQWL
jgi:hypothetical protein